MAFAQFYYDPALEFERLLEDDGESSASANAALVDVSAPRRMPAGVAGAQNKSRSTGEVTRPATVDGEPRSPGQGSTSRWFGDGFLKRRATTGPVNGGSHPCIPK
ncbi:hypothetical protein FKP32DRAFT_1672002 [Trametes sanguinea]|nr:hypothetical protein FKP32DRAFT_1672002 [Trametes sanguinea]